MHRFLKKGNIPWNKGKKVELTDYLKSIRRSNKEVFVENSDYARHHIKRRILEENMIEYRCVCCGIGPEISKRNNGQSIQLAMESLLKSAEA